MASRVATGAQNHGCAGHGVQCSALDRNRLMAPTNDEHARLNDRDASQGAAEGLADQKVTRRLPGAGHAEVRGDWGERGVHWNERGPMGWTGFGKAQEGAQARWQQAAPIQASLTESFYDPFENFNTDVVTSLGSNARNRPAASRDGITK